MSSPLLQEQRDIEEMAREYDDGDDESAYIPPARSSGVGVGSLSEFGQRFEAGSPSSVSFVRTDDDMDSGDFSWDSRGAEYLLPQSQEGSVNGDDSDSSRSHDVKQEVRVHVNSAGHAEQLTRGGQSGRAILTGVDSRAQGSRPSETKRRLGYDVVSQRRSRRPQFIRSVDKMWEAHKVALVTCLLVFVAATLLAILIKPKATKYSTFVIPAELLSRWSLPNAVCPDGKALSLELNGLAFVLTCGKFGLTWKAYTSMGITVIVFIAMVRNQSPELVLLATSILLILMRIVTSDQAWAGFSDHSVLTVAVLFIVAFAIQKVETLDIVLPNLLGKPRTLFTAHLRMMLSVAVFSAFVNNMPVVAMMIPLVSTWARRINFPESKLLMPLSFASMLGGMCTLIGSPSNLIVQSLLHKYDPDPNHDVSMFELVPVAAPTALIGILYMALASRFLPEASDKVEVTTQAKRLEFRERAKSTVFRAVPLESLGDTHKRYNIAFRIVRGVAGNTLVGKTLRSAGILRTENARLVKLIRSSGMILWPDQDDLSDSDEDQSNTGSRKSVNASSVDEKVPATPRGGARVSSRGGLHRRTPSGLAAALWKGVAGPSAPPRIGFVSAEMGGWDPHTVLEKGDVLLFKGTPDAIVQLRKLRGLVPFSRDLAHMGRHRRLRLLAEAVLSKHSPLVGRSLHSTKISQTYSAALLGIRTASQTEVMSVDNSPYVLQPGDSLLLEVFPQFLDLYQDSSEFALIRAVHNSQPPRYGSAMDQFRVFFSVFAIISMIFLTGAGACDLLTSSMLTAGALIFTKCLTIEEAMSAIHVRVLLTIVAAFNLGTAMESTGVSSFIAQGLLKVSVKLGPYGVLGAVSLFASTTSCLVSRNTAVIIVFPIVYRANGLIAELTIKQLLSVLMIGASCSFATPIASQTNLMVLRPGRYTFSHFVKYGLPLQIITAVSSVLLTRALM